MSPRRRPSPSQQTAPARTWRRRALSPTAVAGLIALLPRLPYLNNDLYLDVSVFTTVGSGLVHGLVPYRDLFDHKGPLTYELFGAIDLLFPASVIGVRVIGFGFVLTAIALLVRLVRRHVSEAGAWVAAILLALTVSSEVFGLEPETEQLAMPMLIGSVLLADRYSLTGSLRAAAGTGAALAGAAMLKPNLALLGLVGLALLLSRRDRRAAAVAAFAAGGAIVVALSISPYVVTGTVGTMLDRVVGYNGRYVSAAAHALAAAGLRDKIDWLRDIPALPFFALGIAGAAYSLWMRRRARFALITLAWALLALAAAKAAIRPISEYYVAAAAPAAVGVALGIEAVCDALAPGARRARLGVAGLAVLPVAVALTFTTLGAPERARLGTDPIMFPLGDRLDSDLAATARVNLHTIAAEVKRATRSSDRIYVACDECQSVYWLSRRQPATRYIFPGIIVPRPAYDAVRADLLRTPPAAVVTFSGVRSDYLRAPIARAGLRPLPGPAGAHAAYRIYARTG